MRPRKTIRIAAAAGSLAVALGAGALALTPASGATTTPSAHAAITALLKKVRPVTPLRTAPGTSRASFATTATVNSTVKGTTYNWAGYVVGKGGTTFRYVYAHFNVPYLDCNSVTSNTTVSSQWVGLDGVTDNAVEQVGIIATCVPGSSGSPATPAYAPFWEMYPGPAYSPGVTMHPGDSVEISVYFNRSTRKYELKFVDTTTGSHFVRNESCPSGANCAKTTAEVISESPLDTTTNEFLPLADFGAAGFNGVTITNLSGSEHGGLQSRFWNTAELTQVASDGPSSQGGPQPYNYNASGSIIPAGTVLDVPTSLYDYNSFLNYWMPVNGG